MFRLNFFIEHEDKYVEGYRSSYNPSLQFPLIFPSPQAFLK
jgi:hypothetical protein